MYLRRLKRKLKYSGFIGLLQNCLVRLGIRIAPFYLFLEDSNQIISELEISRFNDCTIELLRDKDISTIAKLPERPIPMEKLLNRLTTGCICFGVKKGEKLVSYTWYNFNECTFEGCRFKLNNNEVYIFDTYTLIDYRGNGLAAFMCYQSFGELKKRGIINQYTIVEVLNKPSLRGKRKLNSRFVLLGLYINLFKKWDHSFLLKNFMQEENILQGRSLC